MAGDVTMKDLQSLQGYVNKKIAELQTQVDKQAKSSDAHFTAINVQSGELAKCIRADKYNELVGKFNDLVKTVNSLSASIDQLKKSSS